MSETVTPMIEPNPEQMRNHLVALFGGDLDGAHLGKIEIRTITKRAAGAPKLDHKYFGTDEIEEAVEWAAAKNREPNTHVYVGAALRDPGIVPFDYASDSDFHAAPAYHLDCDDPGAWEKARAEWTQRGVAPSFVTYTSRQPHTRAQAWWRLDEPQRDPAAYHDQLRALAVALFGDVTVCNPSRIMRLAGTINWPTKPGRLLELTEFKQAANHRVYAIGQIARAVPPLQASFADAPRDQSRFGPEPQAGQAASAPVAERVDFDPAKANVTELLREIRAGRQWHNNVVRLVAHWISRGWSDAEIDGMAESLTLPGYTAAQTRAEMLKAAQGARQKWSYPNQDEVVQTPEEQAQAAQDEIKPRPIGLLNAAAIAPRPWLLGKHFIRGFVTVTIAPGGVGKSTLAIAEGIAVATGKPITGAICHEGTGAGKVWIYNNEDPRDELERRVVAIAKQFSIPIADLSSQLFVNSGLDRRLIVAKDDGRGNVVMTPDVAALSAHIKRHNVALMVIDPFVRVHQLEENDNGAQDEVMSVFSRIAAKTGCVFHLIHHTRKPPGGSSEGHAGNMDSGRGAGSVAAAARIVRTLSDMSIKDAERYGINEDERRRYVRLDDAKANLSAPGQETEWFEKVGVELGNGRGFFPGGDTVGVLARVELEEVEQVKADVGNVLEIVARVIDGDEKVTMRELSRRVAKDGELRVAERKAWTIINDLIPVWPHEARAENWLLSKTKSSTDERAPFMVVKRRI